MRRSAQGWTRCVAWVTDDRSGSRWLLDCSAVCRLERRIQGTAPLCYQQPNLQGAHLVSKLLRKLSTVPLGGAPCALSAAISPLPAACSHLVSRGAFGRSRGRRVRGQSASPDKPYRSPDKKRVLGVGPNSPKLYITPETRLRVMGHAPPCGESCPAARLRGSFSLRGRSAGPLASPGARATALLPGDGAATPRGRARA